MTGQRSCAVEDEYNQQHLVNISAYFWIFFFSKLPSLHVININTRWKSVGAVKLLTGAVCEVSSEEKDNSQDKEHGNDDIHHCDTHQHISWIRGFKS